MSDTPEMERPGSEMERFNPSKRTDVAVGPANENTAVALAARSRAEIEARTYLALTRPRDMREFEKRILLRCDNPAFAEVAWYKKPIGKKKTLDGLSIRFAEECVRLYGNLDISSIVVGEDDDVRRVQCCVVDLESNVPWRTEVTVPKTVQRRFKADGDDVLRTIVNRQGDTLFIRRASDDEVRILQNREIAFAIRNLILNHVPSEIKEAAEEHIVTALEGAIAKDPAKYAAKLARSFFKQGVTEEQLGEFLRKPFAEANKAELFLLTSIGEGIKSGEATWKDVMEERHGAAKPEASSKSAGAKLAEMVKVADDAAPDPVREKLKAQSRWIILVDKPSRTDAEDLELDELSTTWQFKKAEPEAK